MSERVIDRVIAMADQLRDQAAEAEQLGRLTDDTVKLMKGAGLIRLLQTKQYQGFEVHPREFAETVMATAALDPAAGWIVGVVGVRPYQLAYADPKVAADVWADDVYTWMASPYAPQGVAKPVDGGHIFNGRWQFSSGTDHCDWIILGAMLGDEQGVPLMPPQMLHMILPRKDYEIVEDSWNVVGLRGTSSKDVIVKDAFVPSYRTMDANKVMYGTGEAAADINAARQELLANADRIYDIVASGKEVSFADRAAGRRTQVRQCGGRCRRSTRYSPAPAATRREWTSRCNGIGATYTSARCTPSTSPGPPITRRC
ncbi:hydroxylase [Mycobacterium lepraemurium]|nr:hydroxylase [Mycobacterium lepraemurium]